MGTYTCQRPIHPGELLKEEIESRKLAQTACRTDGHFLQDSE